MIYSNKLDNYKNNHAISYEVKLTNSLAKKQSKQIHLYQRKYSFTNQSQSF